MSAMDRVNSLSRSLVSAGRLNLRHLTAVAWFQPIKLKNIAEIAEPFVEIIDGLSPPTTPVFELQADKE
jgi:hypothetical protein